LWGVTENGGSASCDCGEVFGIKPADPAGLERAAFEGDNGGNGVYEPSHPAATPITIGTRVVGTSVDGGPPCKQRVTGCGTLWMLDPSTGRIKMLHYFEDKDGTTPLGITSNYAGQSDAATTIVGVTKYGGTTDNCGFRGCGMTYRVAADTSSFVATDLAPAQGINPASAPIWNPYDQRYYITTTAGGGDGSCAGGCGTLFVMGAITHWWKANAFSMSPKLGYQVYAGLADETDNANTGDLLGVAAEGGKTQCNCGTVFTVEVGVRKGQKGGAVLDTHSFAGGDDGAYPQAKFTHIGEDYYGTTLRGGGTGCGGSGCGTIFTLDPKHGYHYTVVYRLPAAQTAKRPVS
jgi:hypothetical protein